MPPARPLTACGIQADPNFGFRNSSVLGLGTMIPTPKDGIVTPISFKVKRRGLRGFLADADRNETEQREIKGEWVITNKLWNKMQLAFTQNTPGGKDRVVLYLHGGEVGFKLAVANFR